MTGPRRAAAAFVVAAALTGGVVLFQGGGGAGDAPDLQWRGESETCPPGLTRADHDAGIALGREYLLHNQEPQGLWVYQWDWLADRKATEDNAIRQAGTTWGTALAHHDQPDPELLAALERALAFWESNTVVADDGRRWIDYGKQSSTASVSLVGLAVVELLRVEGAVSAERRAELEALLGGYLAFVASMRAPLGGFYANFDPATGASTTAPNPYCDGETLLFLTKAARYTGREVLKDKIIQWAYDDWQLNVAQPLAKDPDPDQTKGYYQWGSMTWFELADAGWQAETWGPRLVDMAVWMIDDHRTLKRRRNTAYAYEGIVPAWEWARRTNDPRQRKLACVIHQGLPKLMSWQVGHPLANDFVSRAPDDPRFRGGIQNAASEAPLRIDVVQHQTHALMLARRFGADGAEL